MKIKVYTVSSFAKTEKGGNPAGVVLDADGLTADLMKKIAGIIGYSETAFVMKSDRANAKVRFFTPEAEVDLCGHATLAVFHVLSSLGMMEPGSYHQETAAGVLRVEVKEDSAIMMEQNPPRFYEVLNKQEIADSLNITAADMPEELPVQVVSTGLKDIFVPIKNLQVLNSIIPNFDTVANISKKYGTVGYHLFTLETLHGANACCRNLAPLYGIPEESATGTSNGALACYLFKYGKIKYPGRAVFEQGYSMKRPSEILVDITIQGEEVTAVMAGGKARNLSEIEMEIR